LPYLISSPGAWTIFTRAQSASISSAITIGRLVREPVPISERCATMVTVPSGAIETNTCGLVTTPFGMSSPPCG
jgi:hypothetical protein